MKSILMLFLLPAPTAAEGNIVNPLRLLGATSTLPQCLLFVQHPIQACHIQVCQQASI